MILDDDVDDVVDNVEDNIVDYTDRLIFAL